MRGCCRLDNFGFLALVKQIGYKKRFRNFEKLRNKNLMIYVCKSKLIRKLKGKLDKKRNLGKKRSLKNNIMYQFKILDK